MTPKLVEISLEEAYLYKDSIPFLCKRGDYFVSVIHFTRDVDHTLPKNTEFGCLYVTDFKRCIPIDELNGLYLIKE